MDPILLRNSFYSELKTMRAIAKDVLEAGNTNRVIHPASPLQSIIVWNEMHSINKIYLFFVEVKPERNKNTTLEDFSQLVHMWWSMASAARNRQEYAIYSYEQVKAYRNKLDAS